MWETTVVEGRSACMENESICFLQRSATLPILAGKSPSAPARAHVHGRRRRRKDNGASPHGCVRVAWLGTPAQVGHRRNDEMALRQGDAGNEFCAAIETGGKTARGRAQRSSKTVRKALHLASNRNSPSRAGRSPKPTRESSSLDRPLRSRGKSPITSSTVQRSPGANTCGAPTRSERMPRMIIR